MNHATTATSHGERAGEGTVTCCDGAEAINYKFTPPRN
jgi:hypothetical protein